MPTINFKVPRSQVAAEDVVYDYDIPYQIRGEAPRTLLLFDDLPAAIDVPYMTGTAQNKLLLTCSELAAKFYKVPNLMKTHSFMMLNYHAAKAKGHGRSDYTTLNADRVLKAIKKFKPTQIMVFGPQAWAFCARHGVEGAQSAASPYMSGASVDALFEGLAVKIFPGLSPRRLTATANYLRKDRTGYLIGEMVRHFAGAALGGDGLGRVRYDESKVKVHVLDSIKRFRKFYDILITKPVIGLDSETDSLNKVEVQMQTLQIGWNPEQVFILPWRRPDNPFTPDEMEEIRTKMRDYFETSKSEHVGVNLNFDLNVIKVAFGLRYYAPKLYDLVAGETGLDENYSVLKQYSNEAKNIYPSSLAAMSHRYGFFGYDTNEIGKKDRIGVGLRPFDEPGVKNYLGYDVSVPLQIRLFQLEIAKRMGYKKFHSVVTDIIGSQIHMFSTMNQEGQLLDIDYLMMLNEPTSPLNQEIKKTVEDIGSSKEVKLAEQLLAEQSGKPQVGFFGAIAGQKFDVSKRAHLETLFGTVMDLEPLKTGVDGVPSYDKWFIAHYEKDYPLLTKFSELNKRKKLRDAFVKAPIKKVAMDPDTIKSHRIRCIYVFFDVLTGRVSARDPNMQQIPSRGPLSKIIKRLYIARKKALTFKVDYRAHEVRGLALVSRDKALGDLFREAEKILVEYVQNPTAENKQRLKTFGDIHMVNAAYFFGVDINSQEAKDFRDAVKAVVFGLIYGRGAKSLAATIGKDLKVVESIMEGFFKRFKAAATWLKENVEFGRKHYYVEAPTGRRRRLWAYLLPNDEQHSRDWRSKAIEVDRVSNNSPIQGMGSDFGFRGARLLTTRAYQQMIKHDFERPPVRIQNMIHDALVNEVDYHYLRQAVKDIEWSLVKGVQKVVTKEMGVEFVLDLGIEFEIGPCDSYLHKWDGSEKTLQTIFVKSMTWQQKVLGHRIDVAEEMGKLYKASELEIDVKELHSATLEELKDTV